MLMLMHIATHTVLRRQLAGRGNDVQGTGVTCIPFSLASCGASGPSSKITRGTIFGTLAPCSIRVSHGQQLGPVHRTQSPHGATIRSIRKASNSVSAST